MRDARLHTQLDIYNIDGSWETYIYIYFFTGSRHLCTMVNPYIHIFSYIYIFINAISSQLCVPHKVDLFLLLLWLTHIFWVQSVIVVVFVVQHAESNFEVITKFAVTLVSRWYPSSAFIQSNLRKPDYKYLYCLSKRI